MKELLTFGRYTKDKFGTKVYKVPISISGFTCPNIDGTAAVGGCTFCENDSFSPNSGKATPLNRKKKFYLNLDSTENPYIDKQLAQLKEQFIAQTQYMRKHYHAQKFLVYFQSFTNTYAPLQTLKTLYETALSFDDVVGLSIGTRTDSITDETLRYLKSLAKDNEIWVEYGVQSMYDSTLKAINRGHDSANTKEWITKTKQAGLLVCAHLILGLPGENHEMMMHTFDETLKLNIDSIKFHPQYVVKRTALANAYAKKEFVPITQEDYIHTLTACLKKLPTHISIQRITAGIDDDTLLAPLWCKDKNANFKAIREHLKQENLRY